MSLSTQGVGAARAADLPTALRHDLPGVRVTLRTVNAAKQISGTKPHESFNEAVDLGIAMEVENPSTDWDLDVSAFGNFRRDKNTNAVTGLGGAFKPIAVINRLGTNPNRDDLTEDFQLRRDWVEGLVGREVVVLEYIVRKTDEGYPRYYTFDMVEAVGRPPEQGEDFDPETDTFETAAERLFDEFLYAWSSGYVKKYRPELADATAQSSGDGAAGEPAPAATGTDPFAPQGTTDYDPMKPDDELPF